jgi:tetratricopeptide (TPR) repeat protein
MKPGLPPSLVFVVALIPTLCHAEVLRLKSGQEVEGKVLRQDKNSVVFDAGIGMPVTYFRDEIKSIGAVSEAPAGAIDVRRQADALEAQAVELIDSQKMADGLKLLRQAITLDPLPQRHMNYGSLLFGNGVELFKAGQTSEAKTTLTQAQDELKAAIEGFDRDKDRPFLGQCYFFLGEISNNAFKDPIRARAYYQKAVLFSDHEGAKTALTALAQNSQNP